MASCRHCYLVGASVNVEWMGYQAFPGKCSSQLSPRKHRPLLGGMFWCAVCKVQEIPNVTTPKTHVTHQVTVAKESRCCIANMQDAGLVGNEGVSYSLFGSLLRKQHSGFPRPFLSLSSGRKAGGSRAHSFCTNFLDPSPWIANLSLSTAEYFSS